MGTWGEGLFDNDAAADGLAALLNRVARQDSLVGAIVVTSRLGATESSWQERIDDAIRSCDDRELERRLRRLRPPWPPQDLGPLGVALGQGWTRTARWSGTAAEGATVESLREQLLDGLERQTRGDESLYELADRLWRLGALVLLPGQALALAPIRERLDACDAATTSEREFWDVYVRNVRTVLDALSV